MGMDELDQPLMELTPERCDPGITLQRMHSRCHQVVPTLQIQYRAFLTQAKSHHAKSLIDEPLVRSLWC